MVERIMKISSKDKLFDKGATMQKLLVVPALGLLLAGCNPADGTATGVASNEGFSLYCPNVGIADNQCVLSDPENPYANETVDDNTKYTLAAAATNERAKFYVWATAQAKSQSGENQYNTALSLHQLFDDNANTAAQAQAKAAYESVLDNYYTSSSEVKVPTDFSADAMSMYTWGAIDLAYTGDSGIDDVIKATAGNGWADGGAWGAAAAVAWENLTPGFAANYTTLEFKVKSDVIETTGNVMVKLDNGALYPAYTGELTIPLSTYGTAIPGKTGWYQISIPISEFKGAEDVAALLGIHTGYGQGGEIMVTDVVFTGDATGNGLVSDLEPDGFVSLHRSGSKVTNFRDLVGENLVEPASLDNLYGTSSAATTALSGMGFSYDTATNSLTAD
jgi:hypothetical protein